MYIPKINNWEDKPAILKFMQRYSFATLVSSDSPYPVASHLPVVCEENNQEIQIFGHFAKANPQWKYLEKNVVLVIFQGPHSYISPQHYDQEQNVPTWNYLSVHAYGTTTLVHNPQGLIEILQKTIKFYEPAYQLQWNSQDSQYQDRLLKGIVGFKIRVDNLQAKQKLSQNKTDTERQKIANFLKMSKLDHERETRQFME